MLKEQIIYATGSTTVQLLIYKSVGWDFNNGYCKAWAAAGKRIEDIPAGAMEAAWREASIKWLESCARNDGGRVVEGMASCWQLTVPADFEGACFMAQPVDKEEEVNG